MPKLKVVYKGQEMDAAKAFEKMAEEKGYIGRAKETYISRFNMAEDFDDATGKKLNIAVMHKYWIAFIDRKGHSQKVVYLGLQKD
jgi:hypothetical protein